MSHPFFAYHGPISIDKISELLKIKIDISSNFEIAYIKDLSNADQNSLTFLHSNRYKEIAKSTKASYCLTTNLLKDLKDAGLKLQDLKTEQTTLEKIFVSLVKENNEI